MNPDVQFSCVVLRQITADVRRLVPGVRLRDGWVYNTGPGRHGDSWEFHYQDFFWSGSASNAYDARCKGWDAYLRKIGAEGYTE